MYKKFVGFFLLTFFIWGGVIVKASSNMDCEQLTCVKAGEQVDFYIDSQSGQFGIEMLYQSSGNLIIEDTVEISVNDGQVISTDLPAAYSYDSEFQENRYSNQVVPTQSISLDTQNFVVRELGATTIQPVLFDFKEGKNKVTIKSINNQIAIDEVAIANQGSFDYSPSSLVTDQITIEAENFDSKNDITVNVKSLNSNTVTPNDPTKKKINVIDEATFKTSGQAISYIVEVPTSGYYDLGLKGKNYSTVKTDLFLNVFVNDVIQTSEHENIAIAESNDFENTLVNAPLYLNAGKNKITIEMSGSKFETITTQITAINDKVQDLENAITQVTGGMVDENRDWQLTQFIPALEADLQEIEDNLNKILVDILELSSGQDNEYSNTIDLMLANIDQLQIDPDNIANNMELLSKGSTSLLTLGIGLKSSIIEHPYALDKIYLIGYQQPITDKSPNFFQQQWFGLNNFIASFNVKETDTLEYNQEIDIWVKRPRQYVDVMQKMADEQFTPETKIKVNFSILTDQNKITMANAANEQPDAVMGIDNWYAYELGMRGAFVDVNEFDITSDITDTMSYGAMIPMTEGDQMYGIPETQDVNVMFYRKDILERYNLEVPTNLKELLEMLPTLQSNGMNFYLPFSGGTSLKSYASTYPFFTQNNTEIYSEDGLTTTIDSVEAYESLSFMTDLYTIYGLPNNVPNFYDSFREGTIPIGIANFSTYVQLTHAAPELSGKWGIAPIPGVVDSNGNVNHTYTGSQTVASLFAKSEKNEITLQFLEWWMQTDTQVDFQNRMIATYGPEYLYNSANKEALMSLPFDPADLETFGIQFDAIIETPKTPGGYYLERGISDIWNSVVFEGENIRSVTAEQVEIVNRELNRKNQEFGYVDQAGQIIKPYEIATKESIQKIQEDK